MSTFFEKAEHIFTSFVGYGIGVAFLGMAIFLTIYFAKNTNNKILVPVVATIPFILFLSLLSPFFPNFVEGPFISKILFGWFFVDVACIVILAYS